MRSQFSLTRQGRRRGGSGRLGSGLSLPRHLYPTCSKSEPFFVIRTQRLLGHSEANLRLMAIVFREHVDADWLIGCHQANPCLCAGAGERSSERCLRRLGNARKSGFVIRRPGIGPATRSSSANGKTACRMVRAPLPCPMARSTSANFQFRHGKETSQGDHPVPLTAISPSANFETAIGTAISSVPLQTMTPELVFDR